MDQEGKRIFLCRIEIHRFYHEPVHDLLKNGKLGGFFLPAPGSEVFVTPLAVRVKIAGTG